MGPACDFFKNHLCFSDVKRQPVVARGLRKIAHDKIVVTSTREDVRNRYALCENDRLDGESFTASKGKSMRRSKTVAAIGIVALCVGATASAQEVLPFPSPPMGGNAPLEILFQQSCA